MDDTREGYKVVRPAKIYGTRRVVALLRIKGVGGLGGVYLATILNNPRVDVPASVPMQVTDFGSPGGTAIVENGHEIGQSTWELVNTAGGSTWGIVVEGVYLRTNSNGLPVYAIDKVLDLFAARVKKTGGTTDGDTTHASDATYSVYAFDDVAMATVMKNRDGTDATNLTPAFARPIGLTIAATFGMVRFDNDGFVQIIVTDEHPDCAPCTPSTSSGNTTTAADAATRAATTPGFIGQLMVQLDTGVLYRATALTVGSWSAV